MNKLNEKREELRSLSIKELQHEAIELRNKIMEKKMQEAGRKGLSAEKPHLYKQYKRDIARIKTIIAEKKKQY